MVAAPASQLERGTDRGAPAGDEHRACQGYTFSLLRYAESALSTSPPADLRPRELAGRLLGYGDLQSAGQEVFPARDPDRTHRLTLSGGMMNYTWTINGEQYPDAAPLEVRAGELVRFEMVNQSMMPHPMHLHGHFFRVRNGTPRGPLKDTVLVEPRMGRLSFDFVADNQGDWFFHCHNLYHMESGMARVVTYKR